MAIRLIHKVCGDTAFFYDDILTPGTAMRAEKATMPDGSHPINGMMMRCGSCGEPIPTLDGTVLELEVDPTTARRLDIGDRDDRKVIDQHICDHSNATKPEYSGGNYGHYGTQRCLDCGAVKDDYTDWKLPE